MTRIRKEEDRTITYISADSDYTWVGITERLKAVFNVLQLNIGLHATTTS